MNINRPASTVADRGHLGVCWACALMTLMLLLAYPAFAWYGYQQSGATGVLAAALAGALCWLGAILALLLAALLQGPSWGAQAVLLGTFFRMGLPLVAGLLLHRFNASLAEANFLGLVLVYYLLTLVVETSLSLRVIGSTGKVARAS